MVMKEVLVVEYDEVSGRINWNFGDHPLNAYLIMGVLHTIQNQLDEHIAEESNE